jgi:Flp pilus assembly protein TadD
LLLVITVTTFLSFAPVLANGFLDWDDDTNFLENPNFRGLGADQLRWALTTHWLRAYQPLAWIFFGFEYSLWKLDPWGYHLTSILFHAAVVIALWALAVMLLKRDTRASSNPENRVGALAVGALSTLLYSVHPLRVETVAWASAQGYLPCTLLALLATAAYVQAIENHGGSRILWMASSLVFFAGSLLSHGLALGLPVALLGLSVGFLHRPRSRSELYQAVQSILPYLPLTLAFAALAMSSKQVRIDAESAAAGSFASGLLNASYSAWFYPAKTVVPLALHARYQNPGPPGHVSLGLGLACGATALTAISLPWVLRRFPGLAASVLGYLALLAPTSGLVHYGKEVVADRYSYLPSIPLFLALAVSLGRLDVIKRRTAAAVILLLLPLLVTLTRDQCRLWHDSSAFLNYLARNGGDGVGDGLVHLKLGLLRARQPGKLVEARAYVEQAIQLNPTNARFHHNLGYLLAREGKIGEAIAAYREACRLDRQYALPRRALGSIFFQQGRYEQAREEYSAVLRLNPDSAQARCDLGLVLENTGEVDAALAQFRTALDLDQNSALAHQELGLILAARNQKAEAIDHLRRALQLQPGLAPARKLLDSLQRAPSASGR